MKYISSLKVSLTVTSEIFNYLLSNDNTSKFWVFFIRAISYKALLKNTSKPDLMFQHKFVLYNAQSKKYYFNPVSKNIENKMSDICPLVNMTQLLVSGKSGQ